MELIKNITALYQGFPPDFEVGENQLTSRESYPVNTPASVQQNELISDKTYCYNEMQPAYYKIKPGLLLHVSHIFVFNDSSIFYNLIYIQPLHHN